MKSSLVLIVWLFANPRWVLADATTAPDTLASPAAVAEKFLSSRRIDLSSISAVTTKWDVTRRLRSATFGVQSGKSEGSSLPAIQIDMNNGQIQLEGYGVAPYTIRQPANHPGRTGGYILATSPEYHESLSLGFESQFYVPRSRPYHIQTCGDADWHVWGSVDESTETIVAKCPIGESAHCFETSMTATLVEVMRDAIGIPPGLSSEHSGKYEQCTLMPDMQIVNEIPCHVLQVKSPGKSAQWSRQYWIDSIDGSRLHKCMFNESRAVVAIFGYESSLDQPEQTQFPNLPRKLSLLRMTSEGNIDDELVMALNSVQAITADKKASQPALVEGALISDFVNEKYYIAHSNEVLKELSPDELKARAVKFEKAAAEAANEVKAKKAARAIKEMDAANRRRRAARWDIWIFEWLIRCLEWPYILITLSVGASTYALATGLMSRLRARKTGPGNKLDCQSSNSNQPERPAIEKL